MSQPRNILFLMTDQHRWDHIGLHPACGLDTPNLDFLAGSAWFRDCVSVNPLCTPARCALLTGRYAHQVNMRTMSGELSPAHRTVPQCLREAGYRTVCIGKTHWWQGWSWFDSRPESRYDMRELNPELRAYGFDRVWECWNKHALGPNRSDYTSHLVSRGYGEEFRDYYERVNGNTFRISDEIRERADPFPFPEEDYLESVVTDHLIGEIRDAAENGQPLYLFGSYFAPHEPYDPPPRFLDRVPCEEVDDFIVRPGEPPLTQEQKKQLWTLRRAYKALILMLDEQVGRILDALRETGLLDETVIFLTSDHGDLLGDHGCTQKGLPFKPSVNVPALIRHPGHLDGRVVEDPVELTDLAATVLEVAGLDPAAALSSEWPSYHDHIPCRSLMPILRGETDRIRDFVFSECDVKWHDREDYRRWCWQMTADSEWKYIRYLDRWAATPGAQRAEWLIHRPSDAEEVVNRAADPACAGPLARLRAALDYINDTTPTAQTNWIPFERRTPIAPK